MPLYDYRCPKGHEFDFVAPMSESSQPRTCPCGEVASRIIKPVRVFGDIEPYISPASGRLITSKRERVEDFRRTGTREYELGEKEDMLRRKASIEQEIDNKVDDIVMRTAAEVGIPTT